MKRIPLRVLLILGAAVSLAAKSIDEIPSEDPVIPRLHSLGLINGRTDIYRCASPTMAVAQEVDGRQPTAADQSRADAKLRHLYGLGIRTVICLESQDAPETTGPVNPEHLAVALERRAAATEGLHYVAFPMSGHGKNSFETMSDRETFHVLEQVSDEIFRDAARGGVVFHCKAGHDRTGLVAGFLRVKYQHWTADQAIAEMRRDGHNWAKFARPGAKSSWLEDHLRAAAAILSQSEPAP